MAPGGIFIFSGMLLPTLKGRQSITGRCSNTNHWKANEKTIAKNNAARLYSLDNAGVILFLYKNMKPINTSNNRSFINDWAAVKGIQSPKQPHSFILPENKA